MNPIQKQLLGLGAAVMLAMLIFPPWTKITHHAVLGLDRSTMQTETQEFAGYSLLFDPPKTQTYSYASPQTLVPGDYYESVQIDFDLFVLQWLTAAFLTAAGLLYFKGSDKTSLKEWWSSPTAAKCQPTTNPPVLRQAPPISETRVPTDVGSSKSTETTPQNQLSPWKRANKAFGFGFFVGAVSVYQGNKNNPSLSSSDRMLLAGIVGVVVGLLSYLAAVGYYEAKGKRCPVAQLTDTSRQRLRSGFHYLVFSLLAIVCAVLTVVLGGVAMGGIIMAFTESSDYFAGVCITLPLTVFFGLATRRCMKKVQ
jgi:hypothetical protein